MGARTQADRANAEPTIHTTWHTKGGFLTPT